MILEVKANLKQLVLGGDLAKKKAARVGSLF